MTLRREEQIGDCRLILGDYREMVESVDVASISLLLTDPPYGISHGCNFRSRGRGQMAECNEYPDVTGDDKPFDPSQLLSLNVPSILWGGNYFANQLPATGGWLVWDKLRPDDLDQATCELAWTNCVKGVRRFSHLWNGMMRHSERGENYHPMQKPVALASWCLSLKGIPDGMVFDPCMGAGWVGVGCVRAGRPFLGCEIEPTYFDIACRRIAREVQLAKCDLFKTEKPVAPVVVPTLFT